MAGVENRIDSTANLPDELLWKVFGYLPLRSKLRLESVNHRFQRIILDLLNRPQPLEVNPYSEETLNGFQIPLEQLSESLWALASKSKFSHIKIWFEENLGERKRSTERTELMDSLLSVLLVTNCLDKVHSFESNYGSSQDIFEKIFTQCVKLSSVGLDFGVRPPIIHLETWWFANETFALDLNTLFKAKAFTQLELKLMGYTQDQLVELFHSLKAHTLRKLSLIFYEVIPPLNLIQMVQQLRTNAWSVLQELEIGWEETTTAHIDLAKFIESLALIPSLNKCDIHFDLVYDIQPENQFMAAMTSLFKSDIKITVSLPWAPCLFRPHISDIADCQAVANIRKLQNVFPNLNVDFTVNYSITILSLSMGNRRFEELMYPNSCGVADCIECHRFYPSVLIALLNIAEDHTDGHLEDYQLDRCRTDTIVENLNEKNDSSFPWSVVSSEVNDEEDLVTIGFEVADEDDVDGTETIQFNVTVNCGPCFNHSCIHCVNVE